MRRQFVKDFFGTMVAFAILVALTVGVVLAEYGLDFFKAHKAGG
jgi:hypothetical protein